MWKRWRDGIQTSRLLPVLSAGEVSGSPLRLWSSGRRSRTGSTTGSATDVPASCGRSSDSRPEQALPEAETISRVSRHQVSRREGNDSSEAVADPPDGKTAK